MTFLDDIFRIKTEMSLYMCDHLDSDVYNLLLIYIQKARMSRVMDEFTNLKRKFVPSHMKSIMNFNDNPYIYNGQVYYTICKSYGVTIRIGSPMLVGGLANQMEKELYIRIIPNKLFGKNR